LESQEKFASVNYPTIPRPLIEKAVGFFRRIEKDHGWEAALIIVWNRHNQELELICPEQKNSFASVSYDIPKLPQHLALIGDIHSHPNFSPTPSTIDEGDELQRPGLHIIVGYITGKLGKEPQFYCAAVVDGERFEIVNHASVMEPYISSDPKSAPKEWLDKVKKAPTTYYTHTEYGFSQSSYSMASSMEGPNEKDAEKVSQILANFSRNLNRPTVYEVRQRLFNNVLSAGYLWCENKAEEFLREWDKNHEQTPN
jgi:hypothetical protein